MLLKYCPNIVVLYFFLSSHFACCAKGNTEFHHALVFGPSTITASRWTATGAVDITKFPFSEGDEYTAYMSDAIAYHYDKNWYLGRPPALPEIYDFNAAKSIFEDAVRNVSQQLSRTLSTTPIYDALFLPTLFNSSSTAAAETAVFPTGRATKDGFKTLGFIASAACRAYGLEKCENLGRTPAECAHTDDLLNLVFVLEFEAQYLHVNLVDVFFEYATFPSSRKTMAREFGWESGRKMREDTGDDAYRQKVYTFLYDFIEAAMSDPTQQPDREDIRAIIVTGSASASAINELQGLARKAVGNSETRVLDTIDPSLVVAHGAAIYARDKSASRKESLEFMSRIGVDEGHDEL